MHKLTKPATITVIIPTCYGGHSLISTVKSLRATRGGKDVRVIVTADRTPLTPNIKLVLKNLGVELYWNDVEGSQFKKIKQLVAKARSAIVISTQDDITFDRRILLSVVNAFQKNPQLTMVGARVLPLFPKTRTEAALAVMVRLIDRVSQTWENGQNYLAASGRFLAFRNSHIQKFRLPDTVVNGDMFLYLENTRLGGKFAQLQDGIVYIRTPQKLKDQIGPSSRFQYSKNELKRYFDFDISPNYSLPKSVFLFAIFKELIRSPLNTIFYLAIFGYTRLKKQPPKVVANPVWAVDPSTKLIT